MWLRGVVAAQQARGGVAMAAIATGIAATEPKFPHTALLVLSFPSLKSMNRIDLLSIYLSLSTSLSYCSSSSNIYKIRRSFTVLSLSAPFFLPTSFPTKCISPSFSFIDEFVL